MSGVARVSLKPQYSEPEIEMYRDNKCNALFIACSLFFVVSFWSPS